MQYFRVEISILNSYTYRHTFSISACLSPIHCKPSISFMRKWHFHSMWCLRSAFNGVHCWMRECVIAGNVCRLFPYTYVRIFYSIWSSFQMYVLQENEEENSLQFFSHSHSHSHHIHTALQYILVDGARVLLSVLLLHLHFFSSSSSSCCCYQAQNSIKVIEQKYFWSWRWRYIVCVIRNVCVSRFSLVTLHPLLFTFPDYITL